ncbi:uncharacterized protein LOC119891540 isoform X2 [Micropterus salmoides]|uniref:uncharacterized protein LOC119891540 isoform X2 n=1 Tax=Micropterus salmoides TaxID=27706 RepID=UPI0018EC4A92|nr:uncharacterized protein LOC119891540 isoform X2 [Micropterus salmoides]XP_038559188.1 uncharacterized protein LOC119891540 isoform X2 [Micropterus salmoides]
MMAGRIKSRRTLSLLILLSLLSLTELFEVKDDEWEELGPDIAALHRLRGLSEHMFHERLQNASDQRVDVDQSLQQCEEGFTSCDTQIKQHVDEQKIQVQQEYSMDPHYSVTVSKECLFNVSCVPEADSDTVVKIFGRVSEDGQTVSGLKAVLETKQGNHQIYQVMNQPDSVSRYQIPQRAVDHSTQYDHQQILIMQDDPTVREAATSLYEKHPAVTSVYVLDQNQRPKLIQGASVPLSEDSRLTLVGHGERDSSGETRLAAYTAQDVAKIIQRTFRTGDKIKTTSVVACEVGSDKEFVETLLRELRETANIETELHLRSAVLQVRHTGEIITQEISKEGLRWRHNDDSKKVVATLDRNGDVIIRTEPGRRGEVVFTNERNFLMPPKKNTQKNPGGKGEASNTQTTDRNSWPDKPQRFIDQNIYTAFQTALNELEALSWGFFHADLPLPQKVNTENLNLNQNYVIGVKNTVNNQLSGIQWKTEQQDLKNILSKCYEIKSGKDVRSIIRHYAKTGEDEPTYLMVKDWIYVVNPVNLYVYPVGKKLDNNQNKTVVENCIVKQIGKEKYTDMRKEILNNKNNCSQYMKDIFLGENTTDLQLCAEPWCTTYFTASVIAESARNFRTFPLILMALDMTESKNNNIKEKGLKFLFEDHSMARGQSWIDPSRRGFSGSATPKGSSKLENQKPRSKEQLMTDLINVLTEEVKLYRSWIQMKGNKIDFKVLQTAIMNCDIEKDYKTFKETINTMC